MISKRTVIPSNSDNVQFVEMSYPVNLIFISKGHKFSISIVHPNGDKTSMTLGFNLKNKQGWYRIDAGPRIFAIDYKANNKNKTLFFSITYFRYQAWPGTYTVSLKVKDYLPPCESINITIKGLFFTGICKF